MPTLPLRLLVQKGGPPVLYKKAGPPVVKHLSKLAGEDHANQDQLQRLASGRIVLFTVVVQDNRKMTHFCVIFVTMTESTKGGPL